MASIAAVKVEEGSGRASGVVLGHSAGAAQLTATAVLDQKIVASQPAMLTVNPAPPKVARVELMPPAAVINRGATLQLTATALDQNNLPITGVGFAWTSGDASVGSIDSSGLAKGVGGAR